MGRIWDKSGSIEWDNNGQLANGALAYFYEGNTTTPLTVYEDGSESTPHAVPVEADGARWPSVFIPFVTSYDVQVMDSGGAQLYYYRAIPNPDPITSTPDTVPTEERVKTGAVHWEPINTIKTGYVRLNGRTIGNAVSGGTERANADTEDLFTYLWNNLANSQAAVSTGRGGSAAADFAAGKTIALLDMRSGLPFGLDDMGNSLASRMPFVPFTNGNSITPGSICGENEHLLTTLEISAHAHMISLTTTADGTHNHTGTSGAGTAHNHGVTDSGHTHTVAALATGAPTQLTGGGSIGPSTNQTITSSNNTTGISINNESAHTHSISSDGAHTHTLSGNTGTTGTGNNHNNVSYGACGTWFIKL